MFFEAITPLKIEFAEIGQRNTFALLSELNRHQP